MKSVEVPDHAPVSSVATLRCNYHLGKDKLYSVKWYKDSSEFYRFVPKKKDDCSSLSAATLLVTLSDTFLGTIPIRKYSPFPEFELM